jgi:hypothetical protein
MIVAREHGLHVSRICPVAIRLARRLIALDA